MSSHFLVILSLIIPLPYCISVQLNSTTTSNTDGVDFSSVKTLEFQIGFNVENIKPQNKNNNTTTLIHSSTEINGVVNTNLGSARAHHRHHFRNAHGILNIIGWGAFLPIGVIVARYFRKVPLKCDEWYDLHVLCQTSGYILGAIGWGVGLWLGSSSNKQHNFKIHRILAIIIFTFATIQMLALCLQPKKEDDNRRYWEIYHQLLGYVLIAMIIANIFEGIHNQAHAEKWKWIYVGILVILGIVALSLEIFRWVKPKTQHQMAFDVNAFTPT